MLVIPGDGGEGWVRGKECLGMLLLLLAMCGGPGAEAQGVGL